MGNRSVLRVRSENVGGPIYLNQGYPFFPTQNSLAYRGKQSSSLSFSYSDKPTLVVLVSPCVSQDCRISGLLLSWAAGDWTAVAGDVTAGHPRSVSMMRPDAPLCFSLLLKRTREGMPTGTWEGKLTGQGASWSEWKTQLGSKGGRGSAPAFPAFLETSLCNEASGTMPCPKQGLPWPSCT